MIRYRSLPARGVAALLGSALVLGGATAAFADQRAVAVPSAVLSAPTYVDRLQTGERLDVGGKLRSRNGQYTLTVEASGSAALLTSSGAALWRTRSAGSGAYLTVKTDGKFVLYDRKGVPIWYGPAVGRGAVVVVQDTGHLVQYAGGSARWWTTRQAYRPVLQMPSPATAGAARPTASPSPSRTPSPTPTRTAAPSPTPTRAVAPSPTPSPTPVAAVPPQESGTRDAAVYPFASTSIWNTPIGSRAAFENASGARTLSLNSGAKPVVNRDSWSVSVSAAGPQDARATLEAVRNKVTYTATIPSGTVATAGEDKHVTVIQPDRLLAYDTFKMEKRSNTLWEAQVAFPVDLTGPGTGTGTRAAGVPAVAGLIRAQELEQNSIRHALAMAIPGEMLKPGPVWPATRQDSDISGYTGAIPMGTLFAVPSSVDVTKLGLSPEGTALARALQDYGAYVVDRAGTVALYCELACDDDGYEKLREAWRVLHPQMRAVTNNGAGAVGGGGSPRVPLLAEVG